MSPEQQDAGTGKPETLRDAEDAADLADRTIVVPHDDATVVVAHDAAASEATAGEATVLASNDERTVAVTGSKTDESTTAGDPVANDEEIPASLAKLLFKSPLDPKRRAPESPFPKDQSSLPRGGVRSGIPVVYGTRSEEVAPAPAGTDFAKWLGPPPLGYEVPHADRTAIPSTAKFNRRFRLVALLGGAAVVLLAAGGLWWVGTELLGTNF